MFCRYVHLHEIYVSLFAWTHQNNPHNAYVERNIIHGLKVNSFHEYSSYIAITFIGLEVDYDFKRNWETLLET